MVIPIAIMVAHLGMPLGVPEIARGQVHGAIRYYLGGRPVPAVVFACDRASDVVATDDQGRYAFTSAHAETALSPQKSTDRSGINSLDALKIIRHADGIQRFSNGNQVRAADVDNDGQVGASDALRVVRAAAGLTVLPSDDWVFDPGRVVLRSREHYAQDVIAIRMGDVDGSWGPDPPFGTEGALRPGAAGTLLSPQGRVAGGAMSLSAPDTSVAEGSVIDVPVRATSLVPIGAISLRIAFDPQVLQFRRVTTGVPGVVFITNQIAGEVRIEWYDVTGGRNPIRFATGPLLILQFSGARGGGRSAIMFTSACAAADTAGNPIQTIVFASGSCTLLATESARSISGRHAVFGAMTHGPSALTFSFDLPEAGSARVALYDASGRLVRSVADGWFGAGLHTVRWNALAAESRPGVYFVRLEAHGLVRTTKVILLSGTPVSR